MMQAVGGKRLDMLLASYQRLTGEVLAEDDDALWFHECPVVAHDDKPVPEFFYANEAALTLFKMSARDFLGLPSQKSAEPDQRAERAAMLARLEAEDIVRDYSGIRVASDGTRFAISDAMIFNLRDDAGERIGQAAVIGKWETL